MSFQNRGRLIAFLITVLALNIPAALYITEIHYHPLSSTVNGVTVDGDLFEFVEIKNTGNQAVDLSGYSFTSGVDYKFPNGASIAAGAFVVIASDSTNFKNRYGFAPYGQFTGNLSNSGEKVTLSDSTGKTVDKVTYKDSSPWPIEPDGIGNSLVPVKTDRSGDPDQPATWRASTNIGGSPGADDLEVSSKVVINEIRSNSESPNTDFIELYNDGTASADIGGWFLTDNSKKPEKFKIPAGTIIPAGGYLVFNEDAFNAKGSDSTGFKFNSHGEEVFIFAADAQGKLTGYSQGFTFGEIEKNVSFGRYVTSTGEAHFVAQSKSTPGAANSGPRIGKVIITEIMYGDSTGVDYLELKNVGNDTVNLFDRDYPTNGWKVNGIGFTFPSQTRINPGQIILLVDDTITVDAFRTKYNISNDVLIFSFSSTLQGEGETVELQKPASPYKKDTVNVVPYILVDKVSYQAKSPWPKDAHHTGKSIHRINASAYGNDPVNWKSDPPSPGVYTTPVIQPIVKSHFRNNQTAVGIDRSNSTCSISLFLSKTQMVSADLFDSKGRLYTNLIRRQLRPGLNVEHFNISRFGNNLLFLRVTASGKTLYVGKFLFSK